MVDTVKRGYTVTLLGTDTQYLPKAGSGYNKKETLSHVSTAIAHANPHEIQEQDPKKLVVRYRNENVVVIDGPTTLGEEIGDRIARAVQAILEAISRGETQINIMAHSRGAVEAILVAHELERLQALYHGGHRPTSDKPYGDGKILCKYTNEAMNRHRIFDSKDINHDKLSENFDHVKVSMFCIDPVPGGSWFGSKYFSTIPWRDPRFYRIPAIVSDYEQILYENERTRCFIPIVPAPDSKNTIFKLSSMPGHHGTGSGNWHAQQTQEAGLEGKGLTTRHVQKLMVLKLSEFLRERGVELDSEFLRERGVELDLEGKYTAFESVNKVLAIKDDKEFKKAANKLKLSLYDKIVKNKEAFEFFNTTSYSTLGQESINGKRKIHYHSRNDYSPLDMHVPRVYGELINSEHALLTVKKALGLEEKESVSELVEHATKNLLKICKEGVIKPGVDLNKSMSEYANSNNANVNLSKETIDLLKKGELFLDNVNLLINEVAQPYLQGQFASNPEERTKVYEALIGAFNSFEQHVRNNPNDEFAIKILNTWNTRLRDTLQTKIDNFQQQYDALTAKLAGKDFLYELRNAVNENIALLMAESTKAKFDDRDNVILTTLNSFKDKLRLIIENETQIGLSEIRAMLNEELTQLASDEKYPNTVMTNTVRNVLGDLIKSAIETSHSHDPKNLTKEAKTLGNEIQKFNKTLWPHFSPINPELPFDKWERELALIKAKAEHIPRYMKLQKENISLKKDLQNKEQQNSILVEELKNKEEEKNNIELNANQALGAQRKELEGVLHVMDQQIGEANRNIAGQEIIINDLSQQLANLKQEILQRDEAILQREQEIQQRDQAILQRDQEIQQRDQAIHALQNPPPGDEFENEDRIPQQPGVVPVVPMFNSVNEDKCRDVIRDTLEPLTKEYLVHLMKAAEIDTKSHSIDAWAEFLVNCKSMSNVNPLLESKLRDVSQLYVDLKTNTYPSTRVAVYFEHLAKFEAKKEPENARTLRHPRTKFVANVCKRTAIAFGVLISGILPGVVLLKVLEKYFDIKPRYGSKGQTFFEKADHVGKKHGLKPKINPEIDSGENPAQDENRGPQ